MIEHLKLASLVPLLPVITLLLGLTAMNAAAFVPEDLARLKSEKKCPGCDLRGADLRELNLAGSDLEGANLLEANLEGVNLDGAVLDDASCEKTNLRNAKLHGATMDHATVDGAEFKGADLQDATWIDGRVCKKGSIGICK